MPRVCTICSCKDVSQINTLIANGGSLRSIAKQFKKHDSSVTRHANYCLALDAQEASVAFKLEQVVDVMEKLTKQLRFAEKLRNAAEEYLSDPDDPLKLHIGPKADEIDIVYLDHEDTYITNHGNTMPKKKRAKLQSLLQSVEAVRNIEVEKITIKHVDIRSFALNAITTANPTIDMIAKIAGVYTDNRPNPVSAALKLVEVIQHKDQCDMETAINTLLRTQKEKNIELASPETLRQLARQNGIKTIQIEGVQ